MMLGGICISVPADLYAGFWSTWWDVWRYQSM